MTEFLRVITTDQFVAHLRRFARLPIETVELDQALLRRLATDVTASEDLPQRARSTVDGYAVRAADTFGASDAIPALLEITRPVEMGTMPDFDIDEGQAAPISTGGYLPEGADAVVMVEYTSRAGASAVEITHPVTLRSNVIERGEDVKAGEPVLRAGSVLRASEIGILAALGITGTSVRRQPRVAVISTGDEIVPIDRKPRLGQIRDANAHSVSALVRASGGLPFSLGIVPDSAVRLRASLESALEQADVVVLSGGSSVGTRDLMVEVVAGLPGAELLAHGVTIRPGKPTLLADLGGKAIFGLPGHPVSALLVAQVFLAPFLKYLQGAELTKGPTGEKVQAMLAVSLHSTSGLEEYVRVRLESGGAKIRAHPVFGKSGMLSTMVKAAGVIVVPMHVEGLAKGDTVEVIRF